MRLKYFLNEDSLYDLPAQQMVAELQKLHDKTSIEKKLSIQLRFAKMNNEIRRANEIGKAIDILKKPQVKFDVQADRTSPQEIERLQAHVLKALGDEHPRRVIISDKDHIVVHGEKYKVGKGDESAHLHKLGDILYINVNHFKKKSDEDKTRVIHHELGHRKMWLAHDDDYDEHADYEIENPELRKLIKKEVGVYALHSMGEFVAEVHADLKKGKKFSDKIMSLYKKAMKE